MIELPPPEIYESEYRFWPWGRLIEKATDLICTSAPHGGMVLDYMCGTGYLLHAVKSRRADLVAVGCTLYPDTHIEYGRKAYPEVLLFHADAQTFTPPASPDIIICTGGLHHLDRAKQLPFIGKVSSELGLGGLFLLGEECVRDYGNERERRHSIVDLASDLISFIVDAGGSDPVVGAAIRVFENDIFERGEYKSSLACLAQMVETHFTLENSIHVWPDACCGYGDYILCCRKGNG